MLIVGCGNIAGCFDSDGNRDSKFPLTHAGAYTRDGRFEIAACVEPDLARKDRFMSDWAIPRGFRSIEEAATTGERFDVVSICSPTNRHVDDLEIAMGLGPQLIFCEKPVTISASETTRLVSACSDRGILLAVNYTRRWDPEILQLKDKIEDKAFGPLRTVVGYYNKGLLNNGSHMLDLLQLLLGTLGVVKVGRHFDDFAGDDPTIPVWLETPSGVPVQLACGHAADFALAELQFVFASAILTMEQGGLIWRERPAIDSDMFRGYRVPGAGTTRPGGYSRAMLSAVDNIFNAIERGAALASTGESALTVQRLCEEIRHHEERLAHA